MDKKRRRLDNEDLEKVNGGFHVFDVNECPLYGEHIWKLNEESGLEQCECGACRSKVIRNIAG